MMWGNYGNYGWWWGGAVHMLLFWIVLILVIAALAKWIFSKPAEPPRGQTALDVLKERYARGEIGKEEFNQKKHHLEGGEKKSCEGRRRELMDSETIVILGAGIGGIVAARPSGAKGGIWGVIRSRSLYQRVATQPRLNIAGKTS